LTRQRAYPIGLGTAPTPAGLSLWKSRSDCETPDLQTRQVELPLCSAETAARFHPPPASWTLFGGVVRPKSRGQIRLTGPNPHDPIEIEANTLSHPDDLQAAIACVEWRRENGKSAALRPYAKREVMPGALNGAALEDFIRDAAVTFHHQTCTARMGRDSMSVVDATLQSMESKTSASQMGPSCRA
jgi:choline dehydrogenase